MEAACVELRRFRRRTLPSASALCFPLLQEFLDRHESHVPQVPSKRPFLCVLSPDTLQLASRLLPRRGLPANYFFVPHSVASVHIFLATHLLPPQRLGALS